MHYWSRIAPECKARRDISSRIFREIWQEQRYDNASDCFTENCVHHFYESIHTERIPGPYGYIWIAQAFREALADLEVTFDLESSGEVVHWSFRGVGLGSLFGVSVPAKAIELAGNDIYRFLGDKVCETWPGWNFEGCLNRLGSVDRAPSRPVSSSETGFRL